MVDTVPSAECDMYTGRIANWMPWSLVYSSIVQVGFTALIFAVPISKI